MCGNATTHFAVPHPPFNHSTLVAMIVPTRMCRVLHPLNCLATPLLCGDACADSKYTIVNSMWSIYSCTYNYSQGRL